MNIAFKGNKEKMTTNDMINKEVIQFCSLNFIHTTIKYCIFPCLQSFLGKDRKFEFTDFVGNICLFNK